MDKLHRVRKNEEFQKIIHKKHSVANNCFVIYFEHKNENEARAGISVSKKLGNAVVRNKLKRQIRMMLQETIDFTTYPYDLIVILRQNFLKNTYDVNKNMLEKALKKVKII